MGVAIGPTTHAGPARRANLTRRAYRNSTRSRISLIQAVGPSGSLFDNTPAVPGLLGSTQSDAASELAEQGRAIEAAAQRNLTAVSELQEKLAEAQKRAEAADEMRRRARDEQETYLRSVQKKAQAAGHAASAVVAERPSGTTDYAARARALLAAAGVTDELQMGSDRSYASSSSSSSSSSSFASSFSSALSAGLAASAGGPSAAGKDADGAAEFLATAAASAADELWGYTNAEPAGPGLVTTQLVLYDTEKDKKKSGWRSAIASVATKAVSVAGGAASKAANVAGGAASKAVNVAGGAASKAANVAGGAASRAVDVAGGAAGKAASVAKRWFSKGD